MNLVNAFVLKILKHQQIHFVCILLTDAAVGFLFSFLKILLLNLILDSKVCKAQFSFRFVHCDVNALTCYMMFFYWTSFCQVCQYLLWEKLWNCHSWKSRKSTPKKRQILMPIPEKSSVRTITDRQQLWENRKHEVAEGNFMRRDVLGQNNRNKEFVE